MDASFYSPYAPVLIDVDDYPSLSKANITGATPKWIEDQANRGYGEAAFLYRQMLMGGLTGVRESSLADLLLSRAKGPKSGVKLDRRNIGANKSFFMPFIMREKEDIINANAFVIESGTVNTNAGSTVGGIEYHDGSWEITVKNSSSQFTSPIKNLERFFLPGEHIIVLNLSNTGAAQQPVMQVEHAINANSGGVQKARVFLKPPVTETTWGTYTDGQKAVYQPTAGVVQLGANSVSDYESWCHNQPVDMSRRLQEYWVQTVRFTRTWDDEFEKFLKYIFEGKVNVYLERFKQLPATEQNKRMYQQFLRKWMNQVFWGDKINEKQTVETYQQLPQVVDPRTGAFIHYKANAVGIYPMLAQAGRVIDYMGQNVDFNVLEEQLYSLKRHREGRTGKTVEDVDLMVDRRNFNRIKSLMGSYYQKKYGATWEKHFGPNDPIKQGENRTLWYRQSYEFDEVGVVLHVYNEEFLSDSKLHFPAAMRSRGNFMYFVDWSDFTLGIAETAKRRSTQPDLENDPDFKCIIKANYTYYDMESFTYTNMIGDEPSHLILTNFDDACPKYTVTVCGADLASNSASNSSD